MKIRRLLIALPTVSRSMKSATAIAVTETAMALQRQSISVGLHNIDSAEIVTARDMFANMLLHSTNGDALLFVDSDMGFSADLIVKMIGRDAEIVAAACPRRTLNLAHFVTGVRKHGNFAKAKAEASDFTVVTDWEDEDAPLHVNDGFANAAAVGMAIALISRDALQAMVDAKVVAPRLDLNSKGGKTCYSFFANVENKGRRLGEDYSFCYRWTKLMGRSLDVCVDEQVTHVGDFNYTARFSDLFA
jgi:hypothetical protein